MHWEEGAFVRDADMPVNIFFPFELCRSVPSPEVRSIVGLRVEVMW